MSNEHPLIEIFSWWNRSYLEKDGFSPEGFAKYFAEDAVFIVNGRVRSTGVLDLSRHFRKVRDTTDSARILLPPERMLQTGDEMFIHYRVSASVAGQEMMEIAMAHACLKDGRIASLDVLSVEQANGT